jgi:hypothetical protein
VPIDVTATPINVDIYSLSIVNFDNTLPYTWTFATGTSIVGFNASNFVINTTNFVPPVGGGAFSVTNTGNDLNIVFTPTLGPILTFAYRCWYHQYRSHIRRNDHQRQWKRDHSERYGIQNTSWCHRY